MNMPSNRPQQAKTTHYLNDMNLIASRLGKLFGVIDVIINYLPSQHRPHIYCIRLKFPTLPILLTMDE
jgi:hypothetical protein